MAVIAFRYLALTCAGLVSSPVCAEYVRTGPASADVPGYMGFVHSTYEVLYVTDGRGQKYELNKIWDSVDDYRIGPKKNSCLLNVSHGDNPIGWALNYVKNPNFYGRKWKTNEKIVKISPESIRFTCVKR